MFQLLLPLPLPLTLYRHPRRNLAHFFKKQARDSNAVLKQSAANVELQRAKADPSHFKKMAIAASQDVSGMQLPTKLRAVYNMDINCQPYGLGYGTWASWLFPMVNVMVK